MTEYRRIENDGKDKPRQDVTRQSYFLSPFLPFLYFLLFSSLFFSFLLFSLTLIYCIPHPLPSWILSLQFQCLSNCPLFVFSLSPSVFYFLFFSTLSLSPPPPPSTIQYLTLNNSHLTTFFLSCRTIVFLSFSFSSSSSSSLVYFSSSLSPTSLIPVTLI